LKNLKVGWICTFQIKKSGNKNF